jgi:tetratricopeptide (TPR) repeat protein
LFLLAAGEQDTLAKANKAYSEGMYAEAVHLYEQITGAGFESPALCYNLGNAYFKLNDLPNAILWYERALRLDPMNEDIIYNLNVANRCISDKIDALPELFYIRWFNDISTTFSLTSWSVFSVICFNLILVSALFYLLSRRPFLRKAGFWSAIVFILLFTFTILFSTASYHKFAKRNEAVVFEPTITVKSSPDEKSIDLFVVHEGTKVQVLDKIGNWYEIKIANGSVGWLPADALRSI